MAASCVQMRHGHYNQHSTPQRVLLVQALGVLRTAVQEQFRFVQSDSVARDLEQSPKRHCSGQTVAAATAGGLESNKSEVITVLDLGCAQGRNSVPMVRAVVESLRGRLDVAPAQAVSVIHCDLPGNDFNSLLRMLSEVQGQGVEGNEACDSSYLDMPRVFASVTAGSFYNVLVPNRSAHLAFTASSAHWLSRVPSKLGPCHAHHMSAPAELWAPFAAQAAVDWEKFVSARACELMPGGLLFAVNMCRGYAPRDGILVGEDSSSFMFENLIGEVCGTLLKEHVLSEAQAREITFPFYYRTPAEFEAPLQKHGFEILSSEIIQTSNSMHDELMNKLDDMGSDLERKAAASAYAWEMVEFLRSWSESSLATSLARATSEPSCNSSNVHELVDIIFSRVHDLVSERRPPLLGHFRRHVLCARLS